MCGSNPLPDAVNKSTGASPPSRARRSAIAFFNSGLNGPRFDPDEAAKLYGPGDVALGRGQKHRGSSNARPIKSISPFACVGNTTPPTNVIASG
jgi:hypothetical protein